MALPSTAAMDWRSIRAEYGLTGAFSLGMCAGLNGSLPTSATAQVSANSFRSARYGPDKVTITRATWQFLGLDFSGYSQPDGYGSVSTRTHHESANRLTGFYAGNSKTYWKATSWGNHWRIYYNGVNKGTGTYNASANQYEFTGTFWAGTATGNAVIEYRYDN